MLSSIEKKKFFQKPSLQTKSKSEYLKTSVTCNHKNKNFIFDKEKKLNINFQQQIQTNSQNASKCQSIGNNLVNNCSIVNQSFFSKYEINKCKYTVYANKFINLLMMDGKKSLACKIFYETLINVRQNSSFESAQSALLQAIDNVKPTLQVRKVRIAGKTYYIPAVIPENNQANFAIRWVIEAAKKRKKSSSQSFKECLAKELLDALKKQGQAREKRDDLHKLASANRAYVRYRWW